MGWQKGRDVVATRLMGVLLVPVVLGVLIDGLLRLVGAVRSKGAERSARFRSLTASVATGLAGLGATIAWLAWGETPASDIRLATLPALTGLVVTAVAGVAERTWPHPEGQVRVATLTARRTVRHLTLRRLLALGVVGTALALLCGGLTSDPDGRSFSRSVGTMTAGGSPYPGWRYGSAVGISIVLLVAATWFSQRQVDARPALGPGHEDLDAALRAVSLVRVLRPAAVSALVTAAGLWITLGATVNQVTQNLRMNDSPQVPHSPGDLVQNLGFAATGFGILLLLASLVALAQNAPGLPRENRTAAHAPGAARVGT
jgi:hypothetical protein